MEGKSSDWLRGPSGPTVCRCCFAEGCYKDISTEYFWMGKREVYAEMLSETLDLTIAYAHTSGPNSNSRLICEPCISRLRDASEFKRQVQECEKMFLQYLDPGREAITDLETIPETLVLEKDVKLEQVKQEKGQSDDDFDDRAAFEDDDDDDLDDQPLTRLASKVPKKESVDLLDLLDNAKVAEKRKSSSKTKTTPAKKAKTKKDTPKATASKAKPEKKKKDDEQAAARRNGQVVVQFTTAYPFKIPESSMVCVYCCDGFEDPIDYRKHMEDEHKSFKVNLAFIHCGQGYIKVDVTDLKCRICGESLENLDLAAKHLKKTHLNQTLNLKYEIGLQPFRLDDKNNWSCLICSAKALSLRHLSRHTQTHFSKLSCEYCGKCYPTMNSLQQHVRFVHFGHERICRKCKKTFSTAEEKSEHLEKFTECRQYCCTVCGDRFILLREKDAHMTEKHGAPVKTFSCPQCNEIFMAKSRLADHFRRTHSEEKYVCPYCGNNFKHKNAMDRHIIVHTQEKSYPCSSCSKTFHRKSSLTQHMWTHSEYKRFECQPCNKKFNQRVSWKTHMKSYHPE
ncbi:uncharacterized protein isoform X12 [Choristoneura fumiferana]|uniref:uncharacterized protein isoform X12 n=1 Tax=Choristoneura fumiferana TaxID=7141 RepID=UPI003D15CD25